MRYCISDLGTAKLRSRQGSHRAPHLAAAQVPYQRMVISQGDRSRPSEKLDVPSHAFCAQHSGD